MKVFCFWGSQTRKGNLNLNAITELLQILKNEKALYTLRKNLVSRSFSLSLAVNNITFVHAL